MERAKGVGIVGADRESLSEGRYKFYAALKYVPMVLFIAFTACVFGVFAAPIAKVSSPNSHIGVYSPGNAYTALFGLLSFDMHVYNTIITLYAVAALGVIYAVFALCTLRRGRYAKRAADVPMGASFAGNVSSGFYIFYLIFSTLSFIIAGRITAIGEGRNVISVGPMIWSLFVAMLFVIILSAIAMFIRYRMEVKYVCLRALEQERLNGSGN